MTSYQHLYNIIMSRPLTDDTYSERAYSVLHAAYPQANLAQINDMQKKEKQNADYINRCNRFFGIEITDGTISCHVLRSVAEFFEEGTAMHHCVYANEYYAKKDSLILSARINDKRIETVEVDLQQMKVVQCYGACDKFTIYHDRIVSLVNDNMNMIKECMKTKQIAI